MSKKILMDTSYLIRLMNKSDSLHSNAVQYLEYFMKEKFEIYLSVIAIAEYSVKDDPDHLPLANFRIITFDYADAKKSGEFYSFLRNKTKPKGLKNSKDTTKRIVVINDCKLIAQIYNRNIDCYITNDENSLKYIIEPIKTHFKFNLEYILLSQSLKDYEGKLF